MQASIEQARTRDPEACLLGPLHKQTDNHDLTTEVTMHILRRAGQGGQGGRGRQDGRVGRCGRDGRGGRGGRDERVGRGGRDGSSERDTAVEQVIAEEAVEEEQVIYSRRGRLIIPKKR